MTDFEMHLKEHKTVVERYVKFKTGNLTDADDILQDTYMTAFHRYDSLTHKESFKPWILSIARSKIMDHYRKRSKDQAALEKVKKDYLCHSGKYQHSEVPFVHETLQQLSKKDKEILILYFWQEFSQGDIAKKLDIPLGTVKSRLHHAKTHFKDIYVMQKGEYTKMLPKLLPEYAIEASEKEPFSVRFEELMGWFIIPKMGEKIVWADYDMPTRTCNCIYTLEVVGKAKIHGIECVEISVYEQTITDRKKHLTHTFFAEQNDTHCRYLAVMRYNNGTKDLITFLDQDDGFFDWSFGENNIGCEINLTHKGDIVRSGNAVTCVTKPYLQDIVGRFTVTIGEKSYDTVCLMDISTAGIATEQYIDQNGKTILWRRFNKDDWGFSRYHQTWSEMLPDNEKLCVNGVTYVHWYDSITDYAI